MPCGFKCPFAERRPCGGFLLCRILMEDGVNYNERKNAMTVLCAFQQQCQKTGRMENTNSAKACYKHNIPAHDPKRAETHSLQIPGSPPRPPKKPKEPEPEPPIPDPGNIPIDVPPVDPDPWGEPIPGEEPIPVVDPVPADPEIPPSPSDDSGNSGGHEDWNSPIGEDTNPPEDPVLPDPEEVTEELEDMGVPVEEPEPEPEPAPTRTGRKKTT